jgi:hypothetical protein
MANGDAKDIYEQLGRLANACERLEMKSDQTYERVLGLPCGEHMQLLKQHGEKLDKLAPPIAAYSQDEISQNVKREAFEASIAKVLRDREKEIEADRDRKSKRVLTWLQIISMTLAILGGGGVIAAVRFMSGAEERLNAQGNVLQKIQARVTKHPDAGEP